MLPSPIHQASSKPITSHTIGVFLEVHFCCHFLAIGDGTDNCLEGLRISPTEIDQEIPRTVSYQGQRIKHEMLRNSKGKDNRLNRRPVCTLTGAGGKIFPCSSWEGGDALPVPFHLPASVTYLKTKQANK